MPSKAVQQILEQGQRCGLLCTAAAQNLITQLMADKTLTLDAMAAQLIEQKILTPYQAEQLLAGRGDECLIAGRYQILAMLGEGGMGAVYKAHDAQLDREVAVKILPARSLNDAGAIARFQREARALAKLAHPNIIQAYDSGADKGRHFLVMEYVDGVNLSALLREQGPIPPTLAADMIYQAAAGLQHAHEKGLVHRDLKPANLLWQLAPMPVERPACATVDPAQAACQLTTSYVPPTALRKGIVRILDLGLARFLQDQLGDAQLTQEGVGIGTPDYMAPEQFRNALHADARTDIYGLGCSLYHLISGIVPFPGSSLAEKADAHARKEPIPLEERCPEVPAGLALVVSKMMAKHPTDRFRTAAEVVAALAPYVAGASHSMVLLRQSMRFHAGQLTLQAPNRRRRLLAWAGGIVAVACLTALLIPAWPSRFPGRSVNLPDDAQSQVVTIENGLTVAKDGAGQYTTIGEALEHIEPGQTIRVLDNAVYPEAIKIANPTRLAGLTLESPNGATIQVPSGAQIGLLVLNVPRVTVRGFRLRTDATTLFLCVVGGRSLGATFEALDVRLDGSACVGVTVEQLNLKDEDSPVVVRNSRFAGLYRGLRVSGEGKPSRRVVFRGNDIAECTAGVWMGGGPVSDLHIVGNRIWNCTEAALQINGLLEGSHGLLIANNSVISSRQGCLQIQEVAQAVQSVRICNNLLIAEAGIDIEFLGKDRAAIAAWQFDHNWRKVRPPARSTPQATTWIAPGGQDTRRDQIVDIPRDPGQANFLRPAKDSPLAKGGAAGDLPSYVGAVPPTGTEAWDWGKTWNARTR